MGDEEDNHGVWEMREGLVRKRDGISKELGKVEESLASISDKIDKTEEYVHRPRDGPKWWWEVYLAAATLALGLESILASSRFPRS